MPDEFVARGPALNRKSSTFENLAKAKVLQPLARFLIGPFADRIFDDLRAEFDHGVRRVASGGIG